MQGFRYWFGMAILLVIPFFFLIQSRDEVASLLLPTQMYQVDRSSVPQISAASWLIFDVTTGEQLAWHDPDTARPIASITKLATAMAWLDTADLMATSTPTWGDLNTYGASGKLRFGAAYTHRELLFPLLLESSNDAAALMQRVMPDLVTHMNTYSGDYQDASGLSTHNQASAVALSALAVRLWNQYQLIVDITRLRAYYPEDNGWLNNSPFLADAQYRGGKHGYIEAAGRTALVFFAEPLTQNTERVLGYVVLDSDDLETDITQLRSYVRNSITYR